MSYETAMKAAGATVHHYEAFGSYQGEWWALVTYNGVTGWVNGSYGSCSGCDAFEAEFGYSGGHYHGEEYVGPYVSDPEDADFKPESCEQCATLRDRFAEFGRGYLDDLMPTEKALAAASEHIEWDSEAPAMVAFITQHAPVEGQ